MTEPTELVVLCDAAGNPIGTAPKATVHTENTPLHQAFSCYLLDGHGNLLLTRRALGKATWPGIWTNSFCGHPGPGETHSAALHRRSQQELGLPQNALIDVQLAIPDFSYRAVDATGVMEWEVCPVFVAQLRDGIEIQPSKSEVEEYRWVSVAEARALVAAHPERYSPWMVDQLAHDELISLLQ